ncbi:ribosomal protein S8e-domain-containing protein [Mycotypha africana]|uniref:ribosomal protein S8e-domain-containing protein n=1 Tax=Mycotypha africana TaxID=64632 RepID=UPI00230039EE|nr:ribosomal protein S8e-domain-containing protein [Mycotypha africana]KAI8971968.1 ribosomal protein S8e-domain-containing protein [Mycotypha africana]
MATQSASISFFNSGQYNRSLFNVGEPINRIFLRLQIVVEDPALNWSQFRSSDNRKGLRSFAVLTLRFHSILLVFADKAFIREKGLKLRIAKYGKEGILIPRLKESLPQHNIDNNIARKGLLKDLSIPQNEHIEQHIKRHGRRLDYEERKRKREARAVHKNSQIAQKVHGFKAKMLNKKRHAEKIQMKKTIKQHEEKNAKQKSADAIPEGAVPTYLLDREGEDRAKILSNMIKQKRKEKAGKWSVPLPTVRGIAEDEMFKVVKTGKSKSKQWKRLVTKATFVGEGFTRKPPKYERFIRPMGLRYKKAHVTHPELKATFCLPIIGVKKNPQSPLYTQLGVITKGTVLEVNVSELGLVTTGGKVVWGKYAQVTNNPENDGCINAVLLV